MARGFLKTLIRIFNWISWNKCIVKSYEMKSRLGFTNAEIIPNGVDLSRFHPIRRSLAIKELDWQSSRKHILFAANPIRKEKNYQLAAKAVKLLSNIKIELHHLDNVPGERMVYYYNAADVILLTSLWEGSPNVIKEAMACNRPIVSTDVGDVSELFMGARGCYTCGFSPADIAGKIEMALGSEHSDARTKISYLSAENIARRILDVYQTLINNWD